ncbi:MAG: hypothetical protein ACYC5A_08050 [Thermoleophilia bacterium]
MTSCPYCHNPFLRTLPGHFEGCPSCGYRSAQVESDDGSYLIIDNNLPDLFSRYQDLDESGDKVVLINRRVGHSAIAGNERRATPASD